MNDIFEELESNLANIQKISGNNHPTVGDILDAILLKYPKIQGLNQDKFDCFKIVIIKHLKNFTSKVLVVQKMFAFVLQDFAKECK